MDPWDSGAVACDSSKGMAVLEPSLTRGEDLTQNFGMVDSGRCDFMRGAQHGKLAQITDAHASIPDHMKTCTLAAATMSEDFKIGSVGLLTA